MLRKNRVREARGAEKQDRGMIPRAGEEMPWRRNGSREGSPVRDASYEVRIGFFFAVLGKSYGASVASGGVPFLEETSAR